MIYHVMIGDRRTTISMNDVLSCLLALKLGYDPEDKHAFTSVRKWLQSRLDENDDRDQKRVSQWLHEEAILHIADQNLEKKFNEWVLNQPD